MVPGATRGPAAKPRSSAMSRSTKRVAGSVREQVIADLKMAGLSRGTQGVYLWCMDRFFQATWVAPERATQEQVAAYLQRIIDRGTCAGTFKPVRAALQFLFENTLERSWKVFPQKIAEFVLLQAQRRAGAGFRPLPQGELAKPEHQDRAVGRGPAGTGLPYGLYSVRLAATGKQTG